MTSIPARLLVSGLLMLSLVGCGYWWGDNAATNRDKAQALDVERAASASLAYKTFSVRATEQKSATDMVAISAIYQKGSSDAVSMHKDVVARVRSGAVRLSVPTRADPGGAAGASASGAGGRDGETRTRLSDSAAEFLTGLASEADGVTLQLSACQAVLDADRTALNHQEQKDRE
ncbi:hypothetical protein BA896_021980 [Janthinobacterium lividum]|uniref:Lipoprotein n=1 Tax=Janthinobacterium lividum TaxID=29581 RepID=A0A1E8PL07_9BURK|nr:hypothetical protein BA896_021980 [Janthinobacterium lividum]